MVLVLFIAIAGFAVILRACRPGPIPRRRRDWFATYPTLPPIQRKARRR